MKLWTLINLSFPLWPVWNVLISLWLVVWNGALCWAPDDRHLIFVIYFCKCLQVLALVGDQLDYGDNICGAVLSIRFNEDILSVWNRNASDHQVSIINFPTVFLCLLSLHNILTMFCLYQAVMALRDSIKRHLKLPHSYVMEYKAHDTSLRDNSSYRNTWLRG